MNSETLPGIIQEWRNIAISEHRINCSRLSADRFLSFLFAGIIHRWIDSGGKAEAILHRQADPRVARRDAVVLLASSKSCSASVHVCVILYS